MRLFTRVYSLAGTRHESTGNPGGAERTGCACAGRECAHAANAAVPPPRTAASRAKHIAYVGVFAALAIVMGWAERFAPLPIPGVRLGLGNGVVLLALYLFGAKSAFGVMLVKIMVSGILFANPISMLYSITGGLASFAVMVTLKHSGVFGMVGVSAAAAVAHNAAQIGMAVVLLQSFVLVYYLPILVIAGVVAGVLTGVLAALSFPVIVRLV